MGNPKNDHENGPAAQKGPQEHAEGQHGSKTHSRFIEQQHEGEHSESRADRAERDRELAARKGGRRLVEDREQHDEAEKNSELTQELRAKE